MKKNLDTYKEMQIVGMKQKDLIVMLYSGAIDYLKKAKEGIIAKDIPQSHNHLNRARKIILHLYSTLDLERGEEIAKKLQSLYAFLVEKVCVANATKDAKYVDEVIPILETLKEGWEKLDIKSFSIPEKMKTIPQKEQEVLSIQA